MVNRLDGHRWDGLSHNRVPDSHYKDIIIVESLRPTTLNGLL